SYLVYPHSYPNDETVIHMNFYIIHNLSTIVHKYECSLLTTPLLFGTNKNGNRHNSTISIIHSFSFIPRDELHTRPAVHLHRAAYSAFEHGGACRGNHRRIVRAKGDRRDIKRNTFFFKYGVQ